MKLNRFFSAMVLIFPLMLGACKQQDDALAVQMSLQEDSSPVLELTATLSEEYGTPLRVIGWWPQTSKKYVVGVDNSANNLPAVLVIKNRKSNGTSTATYYLDVTLNRVANGYSYHLAPLHLDKDMYGSVITLNRADEWFVSLYFKGTYDQANKRMSYNPNPWLDQNRVPALMSNLWMERIDHPIVTNWMAFKLYNQDAQSNKLVFRPESETSLKLIPKGTLLVAAFHNQTNRRQSVRFVGLRSNALSFKGYYSLAEGDLPSLPTRGTTVGGGEHRWYPIDTQNSSGQYDTGYCRMYQRSNRDRDRHTPNPMPNDITWSDFCPVFWGMPVPQANPRTELYGKHRYHNGSQTNDRDHIVEETYWSSTRMPQHVSIAVTGKVTK